MYAIRKLMTVLLLVTVGVPWWIDKKTKRIIKEAKVHDPSTQRRYGAIYDALELPTHDKMGKDICKSFDEHDQIDDILQRDLSGKRTDIANLFLDADTVIYK